MAEPAHVSDPVVPEEEFVRAGVYSLIGTLLSAPPDQAVFDLLASIEVGSEARDKHIATQHPIGVESIVA